LTLFLSIVAPPPRSALFPYTTLFRSERPVRSSAFRTGEVGEDLRRLARDLEAALLVQVIDGAAVPLDALDRVECDVALLRPGRQIGRAHVLNSSHDQISYAVFCLKKK